MSNAFSKFVQTSLTCLEPGMMTQSMDPSVLAGRLDNCAARGAEDAASSCAATDPAAVMSQSADSSMLRGRGDNLNTAHQSPARPRTLFSNRGAGGGSTDSGIRCWTKQSPFAKFR